MTAKAILLRRKKSEAQPPGRFVLCVLWMPINTQRGNDGQPPWFEHDQMTVAGKSCCDAPGLTRQRKRPVVCSAGYDGSGLYGEGEKVVLCECDEDYEGEKCCPRCGTGVYTGRGGGRRCRRKMPGLIIRYEAVMVASGAVCGDAVPGNGFQCGDCGA